MKELTFREVIANIKEGEVWDSGYKRIYINSRGYIEIVYIDDGSSSSMMFPDYENFKLQRNKVSFSTAFKAFKEGKEIESFVSGYCFINKHKEYLTVKDDDSHTYFEMDPMFSFEEIQGEWYIN